MDFLRGADKDDKFNGEWYAMSQKLPLAAKQFHGGFNEHTVADWMEAIVGICYAQATSFERFPDGVFVEVSPPYLTERQTELGKMLWQLFVEIGLSASPDDYKSLGQRETQQRPSPMTPFKCCECDRETAQEHGQDVTRLLWHTFKLFVVRVLRNMLCMNNVPVASCNSHGMPRT